MEANREPETFIRPGPKTGGLTATRKEGTGRLSSVHNTRNAATNAGRPMAKMNERSEPVIHGWVGCVRDRDSFGHDPCPPKNPKYQRPLAEGSRFLRRKSSATGTSVDRIRLRGRLAELWTKWYSLYVFSSRKMKENEYDCTIIVHPARD